MGGGDFFYQAEDGIRDLVRSRGLGDVYKRQVIDCAAQEDRLSLHGHLDVLSLEFAGQFALDGCSCLLYTSDAADERSSVDLGGRRILKKKKHTHPSCPSAPYLRIILTPSYIQHITTPRPSPDLTIQ